MIAEVNCESIDGTPWHVGVIVSMFTGLMGWHDIVLLTCRAPHDFVVRHMTRCSFDRRLVLEGGTLEWV